jgi:hypothetical protein
MSDPTSTDPVRRFNPQTASAVATTWTTIWTWFAAIAAAAVVLALAFGYDRSDLAHNHLRAPTTTGSAPGSAPPAPLSAPRPGDEDRPGTAAPAIPADDQ